MIVVMKPGASEMQINEVLSRLDELQLSGELSRGEERTVIGVLGSPIVEGLGRALEALPGVEQTLRVTKPYKLASREFNPHPTIVRVRDVEIGGRDVVVIAGPCSVENEDTLLRTAWAVRESGARLLRGGAYKPRTSPYAFRGLGEHGLELLARAREETGLGDRDRGDGPRAMSRWSAGMPTCSRSARATCRTTRCSRKSAARDTPVLLKRGLSATIEEWLLAAEYVMAQGNRQVILCERGIRTFETATRNTFDLNAVPYAKRVSHLPVIADPSHATGKWQLVTPLALAATACGADGLIVEVHPDPDRALSDGAQSLTLENFARLMEQVAAVATAIGRGVAPSLAETAA